jgi:deoxyribonuclease-4
MLSDGRRIGAHMPLGTGMVKAAERAAEIGADAIQVFSDNPTAWRRRAAPPAELPAFRRRLEVLGVAPLAIHASYLVNLAGPDPDFFERSIGVLSDELRTAMLYGARFINVHIGSHRGRGLDFGVARIAEAVARTFDEAGPDASPDAVLVLENSAGGGFGIGATVEELAAILAAVDARGIDPQRVGICLDAAHLWGAGYPISDPAEVDAVVAAFDAQIGLARLQMIHLNDSRSELGSHTDRHQHVGAGKIGPIGMRRLITHPALAHVTYVIETPGMDEGYDKVNLERARLLARGEPLPQLRPEELEMPGSRSRSAPADEEVPGGGSNPGARPRARAATPGHHETAGAVRPASGRNVRSGGRRETGGGAARGGAPRKTSGGSKP